MVVAVGLLGLAGPAPAGAGIQIGQTFTPPTNSGAGYTEIQSTSPLNQYAAPSPGVITSWSFQAAASGVPQSLKLKVARAAGGDNFTIIGESPSHVPVASMLNTYTDVRIPVEAGDVIGFYVGGSLTAKVYEIGAGPSYGEHEKNEDVLPGTTTTFLSPQDIHLDVSAILEPDCDGDGFGDETQDGDLSPCPPPPETQITKGPKDKTKKKTATFEFSSSEPGATFECSLDGAAVTPCTSPDTVKVKKGKHTFQVRAKDAGNNTDGSPASDDWKVKKKRKR